MYFYMFLQGFAPEPKQTVPARLQLTVSIVTPPPMTTPTPGSGVIRTTRPPTPPTPKLQRGCLGGVGVLARRAGGAGRQPPPLTSNFHIVALLFALLFACSFAFSPFSIRLTAEHTFEPNPLTYLNVLARGPFAFLSAEAFCQISDLLDVTFFHVVSSGCCRRGLRRPHNAVKRIARRDLARV